MNKLKFVKEYGATGNAADNSKYDANANITQINITTLAYEMHKLDNIRINRQLLVEKITETFGEEVAQNYIEDLESHLLYCHDESSLFPYCVSISLYPFLVEGLKPLGGESGPPKHLWSFAGSFINLMFAVSAQFAGAVASVEFLNVFDHFARKDFGDDYLKSHSREVNNYLQQIIYNLNQPAAVRNWQSIFFNISILDENYFQSLFEGFYFPDGDKPNWESVKKLQVYFMKWFNKERESALLTFPVITAAMLTKDGKPVDAEFEDFCAEELAQGNSFFIYQSDSVDSLSSCCFDGSQEILIKDSRYGVKRLTFKELNERGHNFKNLTYYHDGSWVKANKVKLPLNPQTKMYRVKLVNEKEILVTDNHINPTLEGDKKTTELNLEDYLLINNSTLDTAGGQDPNLTYEKGLLIGSYLGDGSCYKRGGSYETTLSLNAKKVKKLEGVLKDWNLYKLKNNVVSAKTSCKEVYFFIKEWVKGDYCFEKSLNLNVLLQSREFRQGILEGYYLTDGGNSNRIYSTSKELIRDIETVCVSLGLNTTINISNRTDQPVVIRGKTSKRNYPLFCLRFYQPCNRRKNPGLYKKKNGQVFFKIKTIEEYTPEENFVYCLEMKDQSEPYFTLNNGIITHNCRLRNEIEKEAFSYSLGAGGVMTGSINVMTLNMNRLIQKGYDLQEVLNRFYKYQVSYRKLMEDFQKRKLLTIYDAGYINMDKQFLTLGINGMVEAAESLGIKPNNNPEYKEFVCSILKQIYDSNREATKKFGYKFNTEFVPAENLGVKNSKWDKKDGLKVERDCYNSYFYPVEDEDISILDKFTLHGRELNQYLDGGSALHLNLEDYPDKEQYKKLIRLAALEGCNYFCTNIPTTFCEDCGYIGKKPLDHCIKCESKNVSHCTRIIGYLKKVKNFSKERQEEHERRFYQNMN